MGDLYCSPTELEDNDKERIVKHLVQPRSAFAPQTGGEDKREREDDAYRSHEVPNLPFAKSVDPPVVVFV